MIVQPRIASKAEHFFHRNRTEMGKQNDQAETKVRISRYEQLHTQYAQSKQAYLKQLLETSTEQQKESLLKI